MSTSAPQFLPAQFAQPVVSPQTASLFRRSPYISASEFLATPTGVAIGSLRPGQAESSQLQALADVIMRASGWADAICFDAGDGTLAATPSTESGWVRVRDDGSIRLQCYYRPVIEVDGIGLGFTPGQMANISSQNAQQVWISESKTIMLPSTTWPPPQTTSTVSPLFGTSQAGRMFAVWSYVSGFPHTSLAETATVGQSILTVTSSAPGGSVVYGVYPGTQVTIHDSAATEVVVVQSVTGTTLTLTAPLQYGHVMPAAPDAVRVSAIPWAVEQAVISLASCLIKVRGTRAQTLPTTPGTPPPKQAIIDAGGLSDFKLAKQMLQPWTVVTRRTA